MREGSISAYASSHDSDESASTTFVRQHGTWKMAGVDDVTIPTPPVIEVCGLTLGDYAGPYRHAPDRTWTVSAHHGVLGRGRSFTALEPIARDVFMGTDDERNLLIFRRDAAGHVSELIERRKFNDLHLARETRAG